jgi:hypothetical protein
MGVYWWEDYRLNDRMNRYKGVAKQECDVFLRSVEESLCL